MIYVFDTSFVGALIIPDEKSQLINQRYSAIKNEDKKYAPQLLWYEIGNVFRNLVLRKRYTYDEVLSFIPRFSALRLIGDTESGADYTERLLRISVDYHLSTYDAAYLELAGRKKAVLCTLDEGLQKAAGRYGVVLSS